jgi:Protein of unknown function (DUF2510)
VGLFALRMVSSQRRHGGRPGTSGPTRSFTQTTGPTDAASRVVEPSGDVGFTGIAPGWLIDPTGRHERRYWSGTEWTEHVSDGGIPGTDPPPGGTGGDR